MRGPRKRASPFPTPYSARRALGASFGCMHTPLNLLVALRAAAAAGDPKAAAFLPMFAAWVLATLPAAGRC